MAYFTIITPTWNQAEYIEDTIKSVLEQRFEDFEYYIIDNCSDDGTEDIVRSYAEKDKRIKYIREPDKGQAEAINKGLRAASGEVVCWINSDDFYFDRYVLENVAAYFKRYPKAGVVAGDAWYCDREKNLTEYNESDRGVGKKMLRRWYYIVQPAVFWKNHGVLLDESYTYAFDWKFFIELFGEEKVLWAHEPYAVYRMYEDNKTGLDNAKRKKEIWRLQQELGDSRLNVAWCRYVYKAYEKAEMKNKPGAKKRIDFMSRMLFHLSGRRIASF
ncbi:MAG: glycosyltransferase [Lachnospiraceae bacterium]|nr:glycosyltransferase [Lachnospiraceae bacterium]